jgi:hypothetical protein
MTNFEAPKRRLRLLDHEAKVKDLTLLRALNAKSAHKRGYLRPHSSGECKWRNSEHHKFLFDVAKY